MEGAGEDVMRQMMGEFEKMGEKEVIIPQLSILPRITPQILRARGICIF